LYKPKKSPNKTNIVNNNIKMVHKNQMAPTKSITEIIMIIEIPKIISKIVIIRKEFLNLIIVMNGSKKEMISGFLNNSILGNNLSCFLTEIKEK
jgi:hypothetical protein